MTVYLTGPDGQNYRIDESEVEKALQQGYRVRQPTEAERAREAAAQQPGQAFVEGVARGATLGFGDALTVPFLKGYTGKDEAQVKREVLLRKQENPAASMTGELTGALGTSVVTGGGASALVGGGLKGAAFEGGLYGLGTMVSESNLENTPLTTERLAAGFLSGALVSGGAHAGFSAIGKGVSLGLQKFGGGALKDTLTKIADDVEFNALAPNKKWRAQNEPFKDYLLKFAKDKGVLGAWDSAVDSPTAAKAKALADSYSPKVSGQMDDLERMVPVQNNDALRMRLVNFVEQRLDDEFGMNPLYEEALKSVKRMTEAIANEPAHTWKSIWDFQSSLFKDTPVTGLSPATAQVKEATRQAVRDFVFDEVAGGANMPQGLAASMRKTGQEARAALAISKALADRAMSLEQQGVLGSVRAQSAGALIGLATGNPVAAIASAVAESQWQKRGGFLTAKVLRSLADSSAAKGIATGLQKHIGGILATAPEYLGAFRYPLAKAAAEGADALLAEHLRQASGPNGQDYMNRLGLVTESPEEVDAAGQKLAVLDGVSRAGSGEDIDGAIDALFGSAPGRKAGVSAPMKAKDFEAYRAQLATDVAQPERVFEGIPDAMRASAPAMTTEAAAKAIQARQFLLSKAPQNPYEGMPAPPKWVPSQADVDKFNRYREAVEKPAQVLKNMANGYIAPEQLEALRAVYPAIYADLQQKIGERLAMWQKPLSYRQRLALSAIVGPAALNMTPQQMQVLQHAQVLATQQQAGQGGSVKRPDGRQDVNEDQMQTESEKLESR